MSILKRIFKSKLSPDWEFTPGATIWKLQVTESGILFGESRDTDAKQLSLFSINLADGTENFRDKTLTEPWWIALEMVVGDVAIMHRFPKPDMPNAQGATVVDCVTGDILWEDEAIRVLCGTEEIILANNGAALRGHDLRLMDARTGAVLEELGDDLAKAEEFQYACAATNSWEGWISSEELSDDDPRFGKSNGLLDRHIEERRGIAESASYGPYTIVSASRRSKSSPEAMLANLVDTLLLVFKETTLIHRDMIATNAPGPSRDTFFIRNGQLIYIREGRTLVALNLNKED